MNKRLQFIHYDGVSKNFTREQAIEYLNKLANKQLSKNLGESLIGEPMAVTYLDDNGVSRVIFAIGIEGEVGEGVLKQYHLIDSCKLEEDIANISGDTGDILEKLEEEIQRAKEAEQDLQEELDNTQDGAGLDGNGGYVKNPNANYIADVNSLNEADVKLDEELARVEQARKDVTGQSGDTYTPNISTTRRPLNYIEDAENLNDADIRLDQGIQALEKETVKNIVVNEISGVVENNIAKLEVKAKDVNIGDYENYHGRAVKPHPIHDEYSVLDAIKQLDLNFIDFVEKEQLERKGIHIVKVTTGLDANVKEAYDLVDKEGRVIENSDRILIYKDSSLQTVYLGHVDDRLESYERPDVIPGTGDTALCFIYQLNNGLYQLVAINIESFLQESEFLDGLRVDNHKVYVKIDENSERFLSVSPNGIKLSGVENTINSAVTIEKERAIAAENSISGNVKTLIENISNFSATTNSELNRLENNTTDVPGDKSALLTQRRRIRQLMKKARF